MGNPLQQFVDRVTRLVHARSFVPVVDVREVVDVCNRLEQLYGSDMVARLRDAVVAKRTVPDDDEDVRVDGTLSDAIKRLRAMVCRTEAIQHLAKAEQYLAEGSILGDANATEQVHEAKLCLDASSGGAGLGCDVSLGGDMTRAEIADMIVSHGRDGERRTGLPVDEWGMLGPGELGVVLGSIGVGKTSVLVAIGRRMSEDAGNDGVVVHFSEELSLGSMITKYASGWRPKGRLNVCAHPSGTASVATLEAHLAKLQAEQSVPVVGVIVDYAALLRSTLTKSNRFERLSEVIVDLRGIGGKYNCPVWTASQPQRGPAKEVRSHVPVHGVRAKCLGLEDVAECWAIPQVSDIVFSINQSQTESENDPPQVRMHRAKVRFPVPHTGRTRHTITCSAHYRTCTFEPLEML
jgi:hypothetical protein